MQKIGLIDIGVGNLRSVYHALNAVGSDVVVSSNNRELADCHKLVFPGVGSYGNVMAKLREFELDVFLLERARNGAHILGICVGMQVIGKSGLEFGEHEGLGLIDNVAQPLTDFSNSQMRLPNVGWLKLDFDYEKSNDHPLFKGGRITDRFYFIHGFALNPKRDGIVATSRYGDAVFSSVAQFKNFYGVQFHPEKSKTQGLKLLSNFINL